jgi:hypothetical protein
LICFNTTVIDGENTWVGAGTCIGSDNTLGYYGPTVSSTRAELEITCIVEEDACVPLEPGSYAETSNQARNLVVSGLFSDGDRVTLDGYTFSSVEGTNSSNRSSGSGAAANPAEVVIEQLATLKFEAGDPEEAARAIDAMERALQAIE